MDWDSAKQILIVLIAIVSVELFRLYTGLPLTIIDITLIPLSSVFLIPSIQYILPRKKKKVDKTVEQPYKQLILSLVTILLLFPLAVWLAITGWQEPFRLFNGVKGGAHGYTLLYLGLIMVCLCIVSVFTIMSKLIRVFRKKA